jgi:hypothetical protein
MNASFLNLSPGVPLSATASAPAGRLESRGLFGIDAAETGVVLRGEVEPQARGLSVAEHAERVVSQLLGDSLAGPDDAR